MSASPPKPVGARFAGMHPMVAAAFVFLATLAAATLGSVMGHLHPLDTTTMRPALAVGALLAFVFGFVTYRMVRRHQRVVARADRISAVARDHHTVRRLAESTGDVLWEIDANHVIRYVSPQATAVFGWTPEELTGRTPFDFMRQEDAMRAREVAARARAKGGRLVGHVRRVIRPDGSPVYVESVGVPFFDSAGNLAGYRGMDRDITSRRALEERERTAQRLDALGTLAGGLAHDFNNILTVILGHAQLALRDDAAPGDVRDSLNEIRVAGQRGQRIVDEIASFAQAGGSPVRQTTDLAAAVRAALGELEIPPGVRTELDLPESRYCVAATRLQISRIVHNLATNALLAMDGAGTLGVRIDRAAPTAIARAQVLRGQEGPAVFLQISDTGVGIDPRVATRIFDPFFTTRPVGEGVGLGLAAVYGIVSGARGGIDLESRPGAGSTFRIYLAECRPESVATGESSMEEFEASDALALLVDDDSQILALSRTMLEQFGFRVRTATTALDAIRQFLENPRGFSVVVTDLNLPDMPGDRLMRRLRAIRPFVPAVVTTGMGAGAPTDLRTTPFDASLPKPYGADDLEHAIRTAIEAQPVV